MKIVKGEDSAFISEAADLLTPFGCPMKSTTFDESPALLAQNVTSVSSILCLCLLIPGEEHRFQFSKCRLLTSFSVLARITTFLYLFADLVLLSEYSLMCQRTTRVVFQCPHVSPQDSSLLPLLFSIGRAKLSLASLAEPWSKENKLIRIKTNEN